MNEIKTITEFLANLFTVQQQTALVIISLCVLALTHNFKIIWFGFWPERRDNRKAAIVRLFAVSAGMLLGVAGYFIGAKQPLWFWLVSGILSSGATILIVDIYKRFIAKVSK